MNEKGVSGGRAQKVLLDIRLRLATEVGDQLLELVFDREFGKEHMLVSLDYILQEQARHREGGDEGAAVDGSGLVDLSGRRSWVLRRFDDVRDERVWGRTVGVPLVKKGVKDYDQLWIVPYSSEDEYFWMLEGTLRGTGGAPDRTGEGHCSECHHVCWARCGKGCQSPRCGHTYGCPSC